MVIEAVDRYRVVEPMFEGVRVVLDALGDRHSPAYIQGISGAAFRIAGICVCAPTCSAQMETKDLLKLLGYEYSEQYLGDDAKDPRLEPNTQTMIAKVKESVDAGRPVLVWHAFTSAEWDVVTGYDDTEGVLLGRGSYAGMDGPAKAKQDRAMEAVSLCPAYGAIFVGARTGELDARAAEIAALKEAVRHARDAQVYRRAGPDLEGLATYDRWAGKFKDPAAKRDMGDSYCYGIYRSTHRAAGEFLREIAPKYPPAAELLVRAAGEFAAEADTLDRAEALVWWSSPEQDAARNAALWPLLAEARDHYAAGMALIEQALPLLADAGDRPWQVPGTHAGQEIAGPDGGRMVWVPPGEFVMGSTDRDADANPDEKPAHPVRITRGFWLGKCPVTFGQWQAYCRKQGLEVGKESAPGDDHPVVCVSWERAEAYCRSYGLELPTEAQWEYAARGPQACKYPWGDAWDERKCCNEANKGPTGTTFPVGSFPAGATWCGALDMAGNAWQWCTDWYDGTYYQTLPVVDPPGPVEGAVSGLASTEPRRVLRGGTFGLGALGCRAAARCRDRVTAADRDYSFRVVLTP